jgi:hypothetical protein
MRRAFLAFLVRHGGVDFGGLNVTKRCEAGSKATKACRHSLAAADRPHASSFRRRGGAGEATFKRCQSRDAGPDLTQIPVGGETPREASLPRLASTASAPNRFELIATTYSQCSHRALP